MNHTLGYVDYAMLGLSLLISLAIGIKFRRSSKDQTIQDYLMAGKDMIKLPVILSICVTMFSGVTLLGASMEVYRYGIQPNFGIVPYSVGMFFASVVFIPVYFECEVSSIYEFLEIRFGLLTRRVVSGLFVVQMVFFMSVVLYAPALSLSAVTDLSLETCIFVVGICCSIYCSVGGLKGVLWTDVFQSVLIFLLMIIVYAKGIGEAGGLEEIFRKSGKGGRLTFFNFEFDMTSRYNVWNLLTKSFIAGMSNFGASQLEAQRMLSFRTLNRARSALLWSIIPTAGLMVLCCTFGLLLFSIFFNCDPLMDGAYTGVQKYDQVLPYYIVSRFSEIPGITGICIAGIFSGSLSSISSALNSLSTVTVLDFIKPLFPHQQFTEQKIVYCAKALTLVYGAICIGFSFVIANADSIHAVAAALNSVLEGPVIAIFLLGVLSRKGTQKCVLFSLLLGVLLSSWMGYGYVFGGRHDPSLPVNTDGCSDNPHDNFQVQNLTSIWNSTLAPPLQKHQNDAFILSRVSFNWISFVGMCATSMFVFIGILITGWNHNVIPADSKCLSPVTKLWRKTSLDESTQKLTGEPRALPEIINLNFNTDDIREKNRINNIN